MIFRYPIIQLNYHAFFSFSVSGRVLCEKNQRREKEEVKKTLVKATPNI